MHLDQQPDSTPTMDNSVTLPSPHAPREPRQAPPDEPADDAQTRRESMRASEPAAKQPYATLERGYMHGAAFLGPSDAQSDFEVAVPHIALSEHQQRETIGSVVEVVEHHGMLFGIAATRGLGHRVGKEPAVRQDSAAYSTDESRRYVVAALSDGVSNSPASSFGASIVTRYAVADVQEQLEAGSVPSDIDWHAVQERIYDEMMAFYEAYGVDVTDRRQMARDIGATCEVLIVDTDPEHPDLSFVRAVLAGDGAGYLFHRDDRHIESLGSWELKDGIFDTSAVSPLPCEQEAPFPIIRDGVIRPGDCLMITTDGIGKDIGTAPTGNDVAEFLYDRLMEHDAKHPITEAELLQTIQYTAPGSQDDRSVIIVWGR